jgi:hypothetical protein
MKMKAVPCSKVGGIAEDWRYGQAGAGNLFYPKVARERHSTGHHPHQHFMALSQMGVNSDMPFCLLAQGDTVILHCH